MQKFDVDDDLAELVERLAKEKPFEHLSFNDALRRVLQNHVAVKAPGEKHDILEELWAEAKAATRKEPKKTPSPSVTEWISMVPELKTKRGLTTWKAVCEVLKIDTAGDSARRKLKNWVKANRPSWPAVPDIN
jgi:hypothetical protein